MIKSFDTWSSLTEAEARGKDVMVDSSGKKHKITYSVQSNTKFVMKIINDLDIIDNAGKITTIGLTAIKAYFNDENQFTQKIGQLTPTFFKAKFIVYTVLKDGEIFGRTKQKIQFEILDRMDAEGKPKYPNVPPTSEFIDAPSFAALSTLSQQIIADLTKTAVAATLPDPQPEKEEDVKPTENKETKPDKGRKFAYTMRANSKLYLMEFAQDGTLIAKTKDGSDPNGTVSYDTANKKVMWATTLDDAQSKDTKVSTATGAPLFYDSEITNTADKTFLEKMFTDDAFRKKILDEYDSKYASTELTPENLRNMLFYKDGKSIFGAAASATTGTEGATDTQSQGLSQANQAAFIKGLENLKTSFNQPAAQTTQTT